MKLSHPTLFLISALLLISGKAFSDTSTKVTSTTISVKHIHVGTKTKYDDFITKMESQLGQMNQAPYISMLGKPENFKQIESIIHSQEGSSGFLTFAVYDHGTFLTTSSGKKAKGRQYVIGNPLIAVQMTTHDFRSALYAPLRILVSEDPTSGYAQIEYDLPSSLFGQFGNSKVDPVALGLDTKLEYLIQKSLQ